MSKGKFGISLTAIAVIAFAFAALRQPLAVLLIAGFALLAEKDEWLNKQTVQALLLTVTYYLIVLVTDWVFGGIARFFALINTLGISSAMSIVNSFVGNVIYIAFIIFCVFAALRNLGGKDANLPFISKMAGGDITKPQPQTPVAQTPVAQTPVAQTPVAQFVPPQATTPIQTPSTQAAAAKSCPSCGTSLAGDSAFCSECGLKIE